MKLEVRDLYSAYEREMYILKGVNLSVPQGSNVIVIGPNGSGKSTLLKSIAGILKPVHGGVFLEKEEITGIELDRIIQRGICYIPQERAVFPQMTVTENLQMGCWVFRKDRSRTRERIEWAMERFPALKDRRNLLAGSLSGGLQRILDIAKSLMTDPSLLLIDEPSVGLAPIIAADIYDQLRALKAEGRTILLVDQDVRSAMEIADEIYVLDLGNVKTHGTRADFEGKLSDIVKGWLI